MLFIGDDDRMHRSDMRIQDGMIVTIGDRINADADEQIVDCRGYLVIPTLADSHVHTPDTILRGLFAGMEMNEWCDGSAQGRMQQQLFEYLDGSVESDEFETLVLYSYLQYLHSGIGFIVETGQADNSHEILTRCADRIGLRAIVDWYGQVPAKEPGSARIACGIHLPEEEDLDEQQLRHVISLRKADGSRVLMTHCLENTWRLGECMRKFGKTTVQLMDEHGLLDENSLLFHCIQASEDDIRRLGNSKANAVCCPVSTMRAKEGLMNVQQMLAHGVNLTIGTDFLDHDLWDSMRFLYTLLCDTSPSVRDAASLAYAMATRNAAAFAWRSGYDGLLAEGKRADLCFLQPVLAFEPLVELPHITTVLHNLVASGHARFVRHVMVDGRFILWNRRCTTVDETTITTAYQRILATLFGSGS
jgi:5-methylthioadenosine/S-adenosylhomocysteine deaminase